MGLLSFLFDLDSKPEQQKKDPFLENWQREENEYSNLADDAFAGDIAAIEEMREEFGDNWQEEW